MNSRISTSLHTDAGTPARFEESTLTGLPPQLVLEGGAIRISAGFTVPDGAAAIWWRELAQAADQAAAWHAARTGGAQ